jgi:hypothetical protein
MKTVNSELQKLCSEKVVDLTRYKILKRLEKMRRHLKLADQRLIQNEEGVWSIKNA